MSSSASSSAAMLLTIVAAGVSGSAVASDALVLAPDDELSLLEQAKAKVNWQHVQAEVWDGQYAHTKDILGSMAIVNQCDCDDSLVRRRPYTVDLDIIANR
jgi:hypothetical protein